MTLLIVEQPSDVDRQCGENATGSEPNSCVTSPGLGLILNSHENEVSDTTNCRAERDNIPSLAISVGDVGDQDAAEETDKVWWCCKSLCRDRVVAHVVDDGWQEV